MEDRMTTDRRGRLEAMLAEKPGDQLLRYMLAMELDKAGESSGGLEIFRSLMTDSPPYVPAFLMAGQLLMRLDRTADAADCFRNGIAAANSQGNAHAAGEMSGFLQQIEIP